ncbi:hypothetical protein B0T10DRAFT_465097 [Thelonectria olida]|uniref:Uncharacterized protein n=1 Tax=Thelonectria olida TaxID=1576542 RepID=A0A9P8VWG6_9HYPO|nr:hypothetical protein B0T10DRAFT_465097 [Thelonectria olida]
MPVKRQPLTARNIARAHTAAVTTIWPTDVPNYATYCDSPSAYYRACSRAGVTPATTTTLATPTKTITTNYDACPVRRVVKRAGEHMGCEYDEGWDSYNMPGIKLF